MRSLPILIATLLTVVAVAAPACGGGDGELSKQSFIERANKICVAANKRIRALPAPDLTDPQATSRTIRRVVAIQHGEIDDLRNLGPPATDKPAINKWLGFVATALREADAAVAALDRSDRKGVNDANSRGVQAQLQADDLARAYGVKSCVATEQTPPPPASAP
jgi:hypothetical protein